MQTRPDAAGMRHAASQLRSKAERVAVVQHRLHNQITCMTFTGPAATRFRTVMNAELHRLREVSRILTDMANALTQAAANVEADPLGFYQTGTN